MRIDAKTPIWVVNDPLGPHSTLPDVCFETHLAGLRLQFAGGLSMDQRPVLYTTQEEAHEEALNRLLAGGSPARSGSTDGSPRGRSCG